MVVYYLPRNSAVSNGHGNLAWFAWYWLYYQRTSVLPQKLDIFLKKRPVVWRWPHRMRAMCLAKIFSTTVPFVVGGSGLPYNTVCLGSPRVSIQTGPRSVRPFCSARDTLRYKIGLSVAVGHTVTLCTEYILWILNVRFSKKSSSIEEYRSDLEFRLNLMYRHCFVHYFNR